MMNKVTNMKWVMIIGLFGILVGGCYVPMPSTGIRSVQVRHIETCTHIGSTGKLKCTHTRTWIK